VPLSVTNVQWKIASELVAIYAGAVLRMQPWADTKLIVALGQPLEEIESRLSQSDLDRDAFWFSLLQSSSAKKPPRDLATPALLAAGCSELVVDQLAKATSGGLVELRLALQQAMPKLADQLPLRARPLIEQWETRGAGLLRSLAKLTHADLLPKRIDVAWMHPLLGGHGIALPQPGVVLMEAMLVNPIEELPELLRLIWLIGLAGWIGPNANRFVSPARWPRIASAALLRATMEAGRDLQVIDDPVRATSIAAHTWRLNQWQSSDEPIVHDWWNQYQQGQTPLPIAIKALDKMLP
jgi:hypothetical protein